MYKFLAFVAILLFATAPCGAKSIFTGEKLNTPFTVHGRLSTYNGSATTRIWVVGSKRMLYVGAASPAMNDVNKLFGDGNGWFTREIFADFTVEPLARDIKGHMRPVRILSIKNVVITQEGRVIAKRKTL